MQISGNPMNYSNYNFKGDEGSLKDKIFKKYEEFKEGVQGQYNETTEKI